MAKAFKKGSFLRLNCSFIYIFLKNNYLESVGRLVQVALGISDLME